MTSHWKRMKNHERRMKKKALKRMKKDEQCITNYKTRMKNHDKCIAWKTDEQLLKMYEQLFKTH